ncbi:hypothetical protein AUK11_01805 [bacterium CG2_30_37_16]|nr:MAG: hypothetical protein AUK11_01805 [bacterium CG2_30_37_16]PIP30507.1 MAG: hypothetical protein COX25_04270 [bacterium (Candidatus Howlettbacteria) CG23_combo_of_CG06-09_8_20_14_all_37_9]PIX99392.1 MAG: hypothetical protein COZ22_02625 [bacterium (Candidatus Howlettbacteria) CG_4_10_14_3_um_filter_37_10]PJB07402.1 MAG: hypothetical protein CO123_00190 [bacterium (Candidatus Howlettbacteria) CG_4_9_14_3_um_filter_37_10]
MEQSPRQQSTELLKKSKNILVITSSGPTGDSIGGLIALSAALKKTGKQVTTILSDAYPENLNFLPFKETLAKDIQGTLDNIIQVNVKDKAIEKLSYNREGDFLNIILTTEGEKLTAGDIEVKESVNFDLIVVLDAPDVDKIDRIYDKYTDLFFKIPVINVDHHAGNEYFGVVNLVDLTATSTCEILTAVIDGLGSNILDQEIATCLLAGIIDDTASYKNINTTPKSFTVSAQLLAAGANQQEIVNHLFKSKSLNTLKLWGKILDGLNVNDSAVWATVDNKTYQSLSATIEDVYGVINELLATIPEVNTVIIFIEDAPGETRIIIRSKKDGNASQMSQVFGITGSKTEAVLQLMGNPAEIAKKFFDRLSNKKISEEKTPENPKTEEIILEEKPKKEEKPVKATPKPAPKKDVKKEKKATNIFADDEDEEQDEEFDMSKMVDDKSGNDIGVWRP